MRTANEIKIEAEATVALYREVTAKCLAIPHSAGKEIFQMSAERDRLRAKVIELAAAYKAAIAA